MMNDKYEPSKHIKAAQHFRETVTKSFIKAGSSIQKLADAAIASYKEAITKQFGGNDQDV